jgi:dienelactone hydrolase
VTALVRDGDQAEIVAARGATPAVVDLYDRPRVVSLFRDADAAVHTASPGDATSADLDSAVVDWPSWPQSAATLRSCGGWWTTVTRTPRIA